MMSFQVNESLHAAAKPVFENDPDLAQGYRIVDAEFYREGNADTGRCVWYVRVITRACRYAITFNSIEGIRHKAVLG